MLGTDPKENRSSAPLDDEHGDAADAADELYARFAPTLRRIALIRYRVRAEDVEALVNDVFAT